MDSLNTGLHTTKIVAINISKMVYWSTFLQSELVHVIREDGESGMKVIYPEEIPFSS